MKQPSSWRNRDYWEGITISDLKELLHWQPAEDGMKDEIFRHYRTCAAHKESHTGWDDQYPGIEELEGDLAAEGLLVALLDGRIAATMTVLPAAGHAEEAFFTPRKNPAYLCRFGLNPALQGHGLGRAMMGKTLAWCREHGYDGVRFFAESNNVLTLHLYESMGFTRFPSIPSDDDSWTEVPFEMLF